MRITRREFTYGLAGAAAIASAAAPRPAAVWERRIYAYGSALPPREGLHRSGIRPVSIARTREGTVYLIRFATPEARVKAWDRFNTDEHWCGIRDTGNVALRQISVYAG